MFILSRNIGMKAIDGMITFTYCNDIEKVEKFYRETFGFKNVIKKDVLKYSRLELQLHQDSQR